MPTQEQLAELDLIYQIISTIPEVHDQTTLEAHIYSSGTKERIEDSLQQHPELRPYVTDCGSAYCVGGWALHLHGWAPDYGGEWLDAEGGRCVTGGPAEQAAQLLGLGEGAYSSYSIFEENRTLADIAVWIRHYKGEISRMEAIGLQHDYAGDENTPVDA